MANKYYAVRKGFQTGLFETWDECKQQVDGYKGAEYKSFKTIREAWNYLGIEEMDLSENELIKNSQDQDTMVAYVDGSYDNLHKEFSYGLIAFRSGEIIRDCMKYDDEELAEMRNVAGEIKGSEAAMKLAIEKNCKTLHIYHDYEGISKWPLGEWKANKEGTKNYKQYYESIKDRLEVKFHKVKGHSGDKYNEEADKLAKQALGI